MESPAAPDMTIANPMAALMSVADFGKLKIQMAMEYQKKLEEFEQRTKPMIYQEILDALPSNELEVLRCQPTWSTVETNGCPLELWKLIVLVYGSKNNGISAEQAKREAWTEYHSLRQDNNESLYNYKVRFDSSVNRMKLVGCTGLSDADLVGDFISKTNSNYSEFVIDLDNAVNNGGGKYPTTLQEAYTRLLNYKSINQVTSSSTNANPAAFIANSKNYQDGKNVYNNKKQTNSSTNENKYDRPCHICGKCGHWKKDCPDRTKFNQKIKKDRKINNDHVKCNLVQCNVNTTSNAKEIRRNILIFDPGSSHTIINNKKLINNYVECNHQVKGIGGITKTIGEGDISVIGPVLYVPESPVNLLSLTKIHDNNGVVDIANDEVRVRYPDNVKLFFKRNNKTNLYEMNINKYIISKWSKLVNTNVSLIHNVINDFSKEEIHRAKLARELSKSLGHASTYSLIKLLNNGSIINCPVTSTDVKNSELIFGKSLELIKGQTTNSKESRRADEEGVILRQNQVLHVDIMHVMEERFLIVVSKPLNLVNVIHFEKAPNSNMLEDALGSVVNSLLAKRFIITKIILDRERCNLNVANKFKNIDVELVGADSHVPVVERIIRTIKEHVRATISGLVYNLPKLFVKHLVYFIVGKINLIPWNDNISAREAFTGIKLDYKRDLALKFGDYVQVKKRSQRSNDVSEARTTGGIALDYKGYGVWSFYCLKTKTIINCSKFTKLPIPEEVISHINSLKSSVNNNKLIKAQESDDYVLSKVKLINIRKDDSDKDKDNDKVSVDGNPGTEKNIKFNNDINKINNNSKSTENSETDKLGGETVINNNSTRHPSNTVASDINNNTNNNTNVDANADANKLGGDVIDINDNNVNQTDLDSNLYAHINLFHVSIKEAINKHGKMAEEAIDKELIQMHDKKVFKFVNHVPTGNKIIPSSMFLKEKFNSDGNFDKLKARLVACGNFQEAMNYNTSSPTVKHETILTCLAIGASKKWFIGCLDVEGAYLESNMDANYPTFMKLNSNLLNRYRKLFPNEHTGNGIVKLCKALYGCQQSSRLWYGKLCKILKKSWFF